MKIRDKLIASMLSGGSGGSDNPVTLVDNYSEQTGVFDLHKQIKHVDIPEGVTEIYGVYSSSSQYSGSFTGFTNLESVSIPSSVTKINSAAFSQAKALKNIVIPDSVTSVGAAVFSGCLALETIVIPTTITNLPQYFFKNCENLKYIYYKGTKVQWNAMSKGTDYSKNMGSNVNGGTQIIYGYTG